MAGAQRELDEGHGLCGDIGSRRIFSDGQYGATGPRMTVEAGEVLPISVKITAYHAGWFEFRLCSPDQFGGLTQDCLNQNVLKIDASTPYYPAIVDYANMKGISGAAGNGDWYKCGVDKSPNQIWPSGSCCYDGGHCSDETNNDDRYVLEFAAGGGAKVYDIKLQIPTDVACDNCVLQWFYQTANSRETYPESFWNCADIEVAGSTGPVTPVSPTPRPTILPTPIVVQPAQPTDSPSTSSPTQTNTTPPSHAVVTTPPSAVVTAPPTSSNNDNGACGTCKGCWWTIVASNIGCYSDWSKSLCAVYENNGYQWCE
jgi:hypothetical protein